jgi:hypothetical protein
MATGASRRSSSLWGQHRRHPSALRRPHESLVWQRGTASEDPTYRTQTWVQCSVLRHLLPSNLSCLVAHPKSAVSLAGRLIALVAPRRASSGRPKDRGCPRSQHHWLDVYNSVRSLVSQVVTELVTYRYRYTGTSVRYCTVPSWKSLKLTPTNSHKIATSIKSMSHAKKSSVH